MTAVSSSVHGWLDHTDRFERVPADPDFAAAVLDRVVVEERTLVGMAIDAELWSKAQALSYDAARKAVEALLVHDGWRARNAAGAHVAVVTFADAWLSEDDDPAARRIAQSFATARKARNDDEYPSPRAITRTAREFRVLVLDSWRLVERVRSAVGRDDVDDIVPS